MKKILVLFNPIAGLGKNLNEENYLREKLGINDATFIDITKKDYKEDVLSLKKEDDIYICGGDGTLNRFVNKFDTIPENDIYYYPTGSGNDFFTDVNGENVIKINKYLKRLPEVEVNGEKYKFINNVGFGIDGYCCEVGDKQHAKDPSAKVNYTKIAIMGLLFHFKRVKAKINVDGKEYSFKHVWLAPTMNGRFYGGGMMAAPNQDRLNEEKTVSLMVMRGKSKIKTLMVFPSIFKGEHVKHKEMVSAFVGHDITVEFDKPTALQIDGETFLGVKKYHVYSK